MPYLTWFTMKNRFGTTEFEYKQTLSTIIVFCVLVELISMVLSYQA